MTNIEKYIDLLDDKMICITGPNSKALIDLYLDFPFHSKCSRRTIISFPEWSKTLEKQVNFVSNLHKTRNTSLIIITQCPWIISDMPREQVLVIGKRRKISYPDNETFGASVNSIMMSILGQQETIGNHAKSVLQSYNKRLKNTDKGEKLTMLIKEISNTMGDSIEKILLLNYAFHKDGRFDKN